MASGGIKQCVQDITVYLMLLVFVSTLGPWQFGYHLAELNAPQDVITCRSKSLSAKGFLSGLPQCISMDDAQFATVSSIFTLGGFLGALSAGPISTNHGRLFAMRILSCFFILGSTLEAVAAGIPIMLVGRLLAGIGAGASLVVVPIYISEIAPPQERGLFGVMTQIAINSGLLLTQVLGYYLSSGSSWRIILGVGGVIGIVHLLSLFLIPESPAWTAANRDSQTAIRTLQRIRGKGHDISDEIAAWGSTSSSSFLRSSTNPESEGLLAAPASNPVLSPVSRRDSTASKASARSPKHVSIIGVIRDPLYRPAIISVVAVTVAQQFTGINSVMMYSVSVLKDVFPSSAALLTIMISLVNFIMTVVCAPLADMLGRKKAILLSSTGMGFSSLALAFSMIYGAKVLSAISVISFVAFFAAGLGPIPYILSSELVGQEARGATQSWALGANWIATFLVAQFFPMINAALGGKGRVYFIFAAMSMFFGAFIAWYVPETKGCKDADEVWGRTRRDD